MVFPSTVKRLSHNGLTLPELMVVALILLPALLVTILVFIRCLSFIDLSQNTSRALWEVKNRMNQIEITPFAQITSSFHQSNFSSANLTGRGVSYVSAVDANLLKVTTSFSWREKDGRVIGEDKNLNGILDAGEDANGNGILDSSVELVTYVRNL